MKSIEFTRDANGIATGAVVHEDSDFNSPPNPPPNSNEDSGDRLNALIANWNEFVRANGGSATRRITALERRISEMVATWNESVDNRAAANKKIAEAQNKKTEAFKEIFEGIAERFKRIEERAEGALCYAGVYAGISQAAKYKHGDCVTHSGQLWYAAEDAPPGRPGEANSGWVLMAKGRE